MTAMEEVLRDIIERIKAGESLEGRKLDGLLAHYNKAAAAPTRRYAKKYLYPAYLKIKAENPGLWRSFGLDEETETTLEALLRMKPRRTQSGVATVTVLTKPWPCSGGCLYCPNDVSMPKSYLADEPACQRAERHCFDPYLQVRSRLRTLDQMGHPTDKVELIVLGGTWDDYPADYRRWFIAELFRGLNEASQDSSDGLEAARRAFYEEQGLPSERPAVQEAYAADQAAVAAGTATYNTVVAARYNKPTPWARVSALQTADFAQVEAEQQRNEQAAHRCVGLVVETRPDAVSVESLSFARRLGCTKMQMGLQSLQDGVLDACQRGTDRARAEGACRLLRRFGFKLHLHFMANLPGATPTSDRADYEQLFARPALRPDELKLYPCVLVAHTGLARLAEQGQWTPYDEATLVSLLATDVEKTAPYTRISRMIRDISAHDIVAGNRKTNLRQMVEQAHQAQYPQSQKSPWSEIRGREIAGGAVDPESLTLVDVIYDAEVAEEHFLQWVDEDGAIAGFCRLSLPYDGVPQPEILRDAALQELGDQVHPAQERVALEGLPDPLLHAAMIREVHVYGRTSSLDGGPSDGVQHQGLGRRLVETACALAQEAGFPAINVISAVGTRDYYRRLGFEDRGLYQQREFAAHPVAPWEGAEAAASEARPPSLARPVRAYEGQDGWIQVFEEETPSGELRILAVDDTFQSALWTDPKQTLAPFAYIRGFDCLFDYLGETPSVLLLGGGAFAYPHQFLFAHSQGRITVIERDPVMVAVARREFHLRQDERAYPERLEVVSEDACRFLEGTEERWDAIIDDVFVGAQADFSLRSEEGLKRIAAHLNPQGIYLANVSLEPGDDQLLWEFAQRAQRVFGYAWTLPCVEELFPESDNWLVVASDHPLEGSSLMELPDLL